VAQLQRRADRQAVRARVRQLPVRFSVVNFTNPASPREIAFADPAPLSDTSLILGGDWSSYWYDGRIYESDMRRGLIIWDLSDPAVAGARKLRHLNPQTQETSFLLRNGGN
jgi:hypothetical protein